MNPGSFGNSLFVHWREPRNRLEEIRLEAAKLQHAYALTIRNRIKSRPPHPQTGARRNTIKAYCTHVGIGYEQFARALRGQVPLQLEDLATAKIVLGDVYKEAIENYEQVEALERSLKATS